MSNDTPENTESTERRGNAGNAGKSERAGGGGLGGGGYGEPTPEQEMGGQDAVQGQSRTGSQGADAGQRAGDAGQSAGQAGQDAGENPSAEYGQRADADELAAEERDTKTDPAAPPPVEPSD